MPDSDARANPDDAPDCQLGPWGNISRLDLASSALSDRNPALHPDGLLLVFTRETDLFATTRATTSSAFGPAVALSCCSIGAADTPAWSPDGFRLYFRVGTTTYEVPYSGGTTFGIPEADPSLSGKAWSFSGDELEVFYSSYDAIEGDDLYASSRTSTASAWTPSSVVAGLDRPAPLNEGWPTFDEAHQTLFFEQNGGPGSETDIATATRSGPGAPFGTPVLVDSLNLGTYVTGDPDISRDGLTMMFYSNRDGNEDLYSATRSCQ